jgi:hypothetical protein
MDFVYQAMDKKMRKFLTNSIEQIEKELDLFQTKQSYIQKKS